MSENNQPPPGGQEPRDPWAPPEHKVPLDKPPVHDQRTLASMPAPPADGQSDGPGGAPASFPGAPGQQAPGQQAPGQQTPGQQTPGQQAPTPGFGAPTPPPAPSHAPSGSYGYPAYPQQAGPDGGYPGYPGQQPGYDAGYPGYPGQPGYGYGGWTGMAAPQNGFGTAAMVLGIIACAAMLCTWGIAGIVLGVLALIFGLLGKGRAARGEANNRGQAIAGVVLGIVGIVAGIVILILMVVVLTHQPTHHDGVYDDDYWNSFLSVAFSAR
ncbi:hypothetical protein ABZ734_15195 [Streptomyces sp. NPDC006660]|uniref:DUF4190 domain-containing protein n=1 Tax=Streptomyces sp. NPDC006660 TaxID=3156901 RepID=UPI0033D268D4